MASQKLLTVHGQELPGIEVPVAPGLPVIPSGPVWWFPCSEVELWLRTKRVKHSEQTPVGGKRIVTNM